jgi:hypothetical protein
MPPKLFEMEGHDPGGKTRLHMLPGVSGDAEFSKCGRYRHWLVRDWRGGGRRFSLDDSFALWIGMNPSTAEANIDDPTIRKEMVFTQREKLYCYVKVNVMDFRSTSPDWLRSPGIVPCSDVNRGMIGLFADRAAKIIVCFGRLHRSLRQYGEAVLDDLKDKELWCLGTNNDGSPKHPLYLSNDTPLVPYSRFTK